MSRPIAFVLAAALGFGAPSLGAPSFGAPSLRARAISRAPGFTRFRTLTLVGRTTRFGLAGPYREVNDLRSGWFRWDADDGFSRTAEGLNARGRWRMDASRRIHPLDSLEAKTVAITESYLARRGYLDDDARRVPIESGGRGNRYDVVAVTPPGGRTALLWIEPGNGHVRRIDVRLAERTRTIRYDDYRNVDGVALPFAISVDDGDEPDARRIAVASYRLSPVAEPLAFAQPAENVADARFAAEPFSRIAMRDTRMPSGFVVVPVGIDGHDPLPFIIDTGGHDILTTDAARRLRLHVVGDGVTFGAGESSTSTAFTRVASASLGTAEMLDQPFVVLDQGLGATVDARGRDAPIAGILGLELFERFTVTLDFKDGFLELRPRGAAPEVAKATLGLTFTSDEPLVDARVDGSSGSFAVDTGNNVGLILYHRWVVQAKLAGLTLLPTTMDGDSIGGAVSFRHATAGSLELGNVKRSNVAALLADARTGSMSSRSEAGNIGVPNLAGLRVTFSYATGTIRLGE